MGDQLDCFRTS